MLLNLLMVAAGNRAEPLVARAGLQRESRNGGQQAVEGKGVIIAQDIERFLLNLRQQVVELNQPLPVAGEDRAAAAFAAGRPVNQGLLAELIHFINGIPCAFIADAGIFGPLANGAGQVNLLQQGDTTGIGEQALL